MKIQLRDLLEELTYEFYMWDTPGNIYDARITAYTNLECIWDFSEYALWFAWEKAVNNTEPDYVKLSADFVESLDYTWKNLNWEEIDIDDFINN